MGWNKVGWIVGILWLASANVYGQGTVLFVDQASGDTNEFIPNFSQVPDSQIAQSFTPSLSAVGFVQFRQVVPAGNNPVTFIVNLRAGFYNGPVLSSTTPVIVVPEPSEFSTFYFPDNIPVTPGQLYFFEPVLLSAGSMNIGYKFPSSYPGGEAWNNGVPSGEASDYWFREGIVVPEPGAVWLLLLGGGVLLSSRRAQSRS